MLFGFLGDFIRGHHFPVCTTYVSWLGTTPLTKRFSLVKTEGRKGVRTIIRTFPDIPLRKPEAVFACESEGFVTSLLTGSQTEHGLWTLQIVVSSRCCFIVCSQSCYQHFGRQLAKTVSFIFYFLKWQLSGTTSHNTQISNGIKTSSLVCSVSKCSLHFSLQFLKVTVVNFQKTDIYKLKSAACLGWTSKPKQIVFPAYFGKYNNFNFCELSFNFASFFLIEVENRRKQLSAEPFKLQYIIIFSTWQCLTRLCILSVHASLHDFSFMNISHGQRGSGNQSSVR